MTREGAEIFAVELEGWLHGLKAFQGKLYPALVQQIIRELGPALRDAVQSGVELDLLSIAQKFLASADGVITERAIIHHLLSQISNPHTLDEDFLYTFAKALNRVEDKFPGVVSSVQQIWRDSRKLAA